VTKGGETFSFFFSREFSHKVLLPSPSKENKAPVVSLAGQKKKKGEWNHQKGVAFQNPLVWGLDQGNFPAWQKMTR
jgi:hypothetical protein